MARVLGECRVNPILVREVRARWRGWRDPGILFGYAALLALSTIVMYATTWIDGDLFARQSGRLGRQMFQALSGMQIAGWILLGPALTATAIAGEREAGLLDMLQLTPLTPRQITLGKLLSVASFFGLLMLAPLPVTAICFLLGGVSPGEFCAAFVLQAATALCAAAIGLFASAWCRRASSALGLAYGITAAWILGSFLVALGHGSTYVLAYAPIGAPIPRLLISASGDFLWRTNPIIAFYNSGSSSWSSIYLPFLRFSDWMLCVLFQIAAAVAMMMSVTRALRHPLPDSVETENTQARGPLRRFFTRSLLSRRPHEYSPEGTSGAATSGAATSGVTLVAAPSDIATAATEAASSGASRVAGRENAWWEWRRVANARFANPVLEREIRRRARMRRPAPWMRQLLRIAGGVLFGGYLWGFIHVFAQPENRREAAWWLASVVCLGIVMCAAASLGAVAFAREREAGTWEGIELSLLSPRQIVWGKAVPPFLACAAFTMLWWTLLLPCVYPVVVSPGWGREGISLTQAVGTLVIALSTAWAYSCWGVFVSWWCRRLWVAVVWSIGSLLLVLVLVPTLLLTSARGYPHDALSILQFWHPLFALTSIASPYGQYNWTTTPVALSYAATMFVFGLMHLLFLGERVKGVLRRDRQAATPLAATLVSADPATRKEGDA